MNLFKELIRKLNLRKTHFLSSLLLLPVILLCLEGVSRAQKQPGSMLKPQEKDVPGKSAFSSTWTSDNGNGTYTNPLFYDEFSDPDMIRVGDDYYLTGTTMHAMPGLPVLHSKDLVNWELLGYAFDKLDLGPEYRLEEGKDAYGQGIWAPCIRYHQGIFYIFTNVNRHNTQVYTATNPAGP